MTISTHRVFKHDKALSIHAKQPWFVLGAAAHYNLVASEDPSISHFYSFEADQTHGLTLAIPDGCVDIVFDCDQTNPHAKVCGTTLEARSAHLTHRHRYFGIRFALGVTPAFLNINADALVDKEISLHELLPDAPALLEYIVNQPSLSEQASLFQRFYRSKGTHKASPLIAHAMQLICQSKGNIQVRELESCTGYTRRTLLRRFKSDVGMSPKAFSRIVRCQFAIRDLSYHNRVVFSDLACDLGFSDQAHFQREFKKLVSTTPQDYQCRIRQGSYLERIQRL